MAILEMHKTSFTAATWMASVETGETNGSMNNTSVFCFVLTCAAKHVRLALHCCLAVSWIRWTNRWRCEETVTEHKIPTKHVGPACNRSISTLILFTWCMKDKANWNLSHFAWSCLGFCTCVFNVDTFCWMWIVIQRVKQQNISESITKAGEIVQLKVDTHHTFICCLVPVHWWGRGKEQKKTFFVNNSNKHVTLYFLWLFTIPFRLQNISETYWHLFPLCVVHVTDTNGHPNWVLMWW